MNRNVRIACIALTLLAAGCADTRRSAPTPSAAPLRVTVQIVAADTGEPVRAAIFVDVQRIAQDVTAATVEIPADNQRHALRVEAQGFDAWSLEVRAGDVRAGRELSGPVRLTRKR